MIAKILIAPIRRRRGWRSVARHGEAGVYQVGTCFACQACFRCGIDTTFENECVCDRGRKVPVKKKPNDDVKLCVFNCRCDPNSPSETQAKKTLFSRSVETFGYDIDIAEAFSFYLCCGCNNTLARLTREERQQTKMQCFSLLIILKTWFFFL